MKNDVRSTFLVTLFTFAGIAVSFINQIVIAGFFGSRPEMDAYVAATTLPRYLIMVLTASLAACFIPIFMDYKANGREDQAWAFASNLINFCLIICGLTTVIGILFANPLLRLIAPGLKAGSIAIGSNLAIIIWPILIASAMSVLLTSIYQAEGYFGWQAAVPVIGSLVMLVTLVLSARFLGIFGLAIATTINISLQSVLLLNIILKQGRYRPILNWRDSGIQQIFKLMLPLIIVSLFSKFTPIIERYLASGLGEGSISRLSYAFRLVTVFSLSISAGISTVIFPRMASDVARGGTALIRHTTSSGFRIMWLCVAPVVSIGFALSHPLIRIVFERGQFTTADSIKVAYFFKIYLFALVGICLGNITVKSLYALKDTKTIAVFAIIEAIAYIIYTILLTRWLGIIGIVVGYVIYFNLSIIWQSIILRVKTGNTGGRTVIKSFAKTAMAALLAGCAAHVISMALRAAVAQLILGGLAGFVIYVLVLYFIRSNEQKLVWNRLLSS